MSGTDRFLPYGRQCIDDDDIAAVVAVLRGDWLTTGPAVAAFEQAFAETVGARHAIACANGTAALHLATLALDLGPGDAALVPSLTFLATTNCARYVGAEVEFCDVDPDTGLAGIAQLEAARVAAVARGLRPRVALPVHLAGQTAPMPAIRAWAEPHGIALVEDACHAAGTRYRAEDQTHAVGACAHSAMAAFSFHPVKTMTTAEGGIVTTNDDRLAERLRRFRSHSMVRDPEALTDTGLATAADGSTNPWYYEMSEIGFNYRLTDVQCALGLAQLAKLGRFVSRRAAIAARYDAALAPLAPAIRGPHRVEDCTPGWHLYAARIDFATLPLDRAALMRRLNEAGIGTQVHYIPVHLQPYYRQRYGRQSLPGAEAYYAGTLSLPMSPDLEDADVDRVVEALAWATADDAPRQASATT